MKYPDLPEFEPEEWWSFVSALRQFMTEEGYVVLWIDIHYEESFEDDPL